MPNRLVILELDERGLIKQCVVSDTTIADSNGEGFEFASLDLGG